MKAKTITLTALLALCTNYSSGMEKAVEHGTETSTPMIASVHKVTAPAISPEMSLTESVSLAANPKNFSNINVLWMDADQKMHLSLLREHFDIVFPKEKAKEISIDWGKANQDLKKF